ncbi:hypothetical protein AB1Y20_002696 [Prymnesium parvum]|uniref:Proteasome inhibitor PI31 subunit n=1 Tax=Prymnesium parvum TaxID=97485 RepID=A0AB34JC48_PRYPA
MASALLRVRTPSGATLKLRVEPTSSHAELLALAAQHAGLDSDVCTLSLNKRHPLSAAPSARLTEMGVAHGDLLYLLTPADAAAPAAAPSPAATPPPPAATPPPAAALRGPESPAAAAAAAAMARASVGRAGATVPAAAAPAAPAGVGGVRVVDGSAYRPAEMPRSPLFDAAAQNVLRGAAKKPAATLVPQALVESMDGALKSSGARGAHEAVCVALHALLLQSGFVLSSLLGTTIHPPSTAPALPPAWRASAGVYVFGYGHTRQGSEGARAVLEVKAVPMGPHLMLVAMVHGAREPALVQHRVRPADFVQPADGPITSVTNLTSTPRLVHELSARMVQPLLEELRTRVMDPSGEGVAFELMDLCPELKFAILAFLDPPALWFARAYRRRTLEERRAAQEAEQQRRHWRMPSPGFAAFPPPGVAPFGGMPGFPSGVPGIIGGDFDRTPGLLPPFHAPRGFPGGGGGLAGGFHPHGAVPPGARYDPISPLIDPDGQSGFGGGIGPMGPMGRGGRGGMRGRGRGGMFGGRFDPDTPDLPDIL